MNVLSDYQNYNYTDPRSLIICCQNYHDCRKKPEIYGVHYQPPPSKTKENEL